MSSSCPMWGCVVNFRTSPCALPAHFRMENKHARALSIRSDLTRAIRMMHESTNWSMRERLAFTAPSVRERIETNESWRGGIASAHNESGTQSPTVCLPVSFPSSLFLFLPPSLLSKAQQHAWLRTRSPAFGISRQCGLTFLTSIHRANIQKVPR